MRKSLLLITSVLFLSAPLLAKEIPHLKKDSNIREAISLNEPKSKKGSQNVTRVCYDKLGCFEVKGTDPQKVLPQSPEKIGTSFLLYTRKNKDDPQKLDYSKSETILKSNLERKLPLIITTHGFGGDSRLPWVRNLKNALLAKHDVNVIVVDWEKGAAMPNYVQAAANTEVVGAQVAALYYLIKDNLDIQEKDLHLIGFSLGAHVVGFVGKNMKKTKNTRPGRITGLDPASYLFDTITIVGNFEYKEMYKPLNKDDADFVDVIHSNADYLKYGGLSIEKPIGHADFYPNGGKQQPGCQIVGEEIFNNIFNPNMVLKVLENEGSCSHNRAVDLYIDSILNLDKCDYLGYKCRNYTSFENFECMDCGNNCGLMGYYAEGQGVYYLLTKANAPFCSTRSEKFQLKVKYAEDVPLTYGKIILSLIGNTGEVQNVTLTHFDETLTPGDEKMTAYALGNNMIPLGSMHVLYKRYVHWVPLQYQSTETFRLSTVSIQNSVGKNVFKAYGPIDLKTDVYQTLVARFTLHVNFAKNNKHSAGRIIFTFVGEGGKQKNEILTKIEEKLSPGDKKILPIELGEGVFPVQRIDVLYERYTGFLITGEATKTFILSGISIKNTTEDDVFRTCRPTTLQDGIPQTLPRTCPDEQIKLSANFSKDIVYSYGTITITLVGMQEKKQNVTLTDVDGYLGPGDVKTVIATLEDGMKPLSRMDIVYERYLDSWWYKSTETFTISELSTEDILEAETRKICGPVILKDRTYQTLDLSC